MISRRSSGWEVSEADWILRSRWCCQPSGLDRVQGLAGACWEAIVVVDVGVLKLQGMSRSSNLSRGIESAAVVNGSFCLGAVDESKWMLIE
jgi:hypothetical protein